MKKTIVYKGYTDRQGAEELNKPPKWASLGEIGDSAWSVLEFFSKKRDNRYQIPCIVTIEVDLGE